MVPHLSTMEMQALPDAPDLGTRSGIRDRALLHLCFAGGPPRLRVGDPAARRAGHADMQTTMAYLRADPSEKLATVTAVVPMPGRRIRLRAPDKLIASLHRR